MDSRSTREEEFNRLLIEIVDETISCLGEKPTKTILFYLNEEFDLPMSEVPGRLEDYSDALKKMLGVGAQILERRIMRQLYAKVHSSTQCRKPSKVGFADYIGSVKLSFLHDHNDSASFTLDLSPEMLESEQQHVRVLGRRFA